MVKCCVAAGCSNTNADGVSLFKFPNDKKLRALWIKQVRRFQAEWMCTEYSVLFCHVASTLVEQLYIPCRLVFMFLISLSLLRAELRTDVTT